MKEKFDRPSSIPEKLNRVKQIFLLRSKENSFRPPLLCKGTGRLFLYGSLMELIEKEKLLIIKNLANKVRPYSSCCSKAAAGENKCINKKDIPYFFYLMKERLYNAFYREEPSIDKEKFLICKYNLYNRSINE